MIVVGELDAGFLAGFAGFVEEIHGALPAAGLDALFFVNPGADDVAVADDFRGLQSFRPLFFDDVVADVAGGRSQAIFVEDGTDVLRRVVEVAGEFDFLVAGGGDFRDGAFEVGFHGVANSVELDADTVDFVRGVRGPGGRAAVASVAAIEVLIKVRRFMGRILLFPGEKGTGIRSKKERRSDQVEPPFRSKGH